jgi:hypothetical protein
MSQSTPKSRGFLFYNLMEKVIKKERTIDLTPLNDYFLNECSPDELSEVLHQTKFMLLTLFIALEDEEKAPEKTAVWFNVHAIDLFQDYLKTVTTKNNMPC